MNKIFSIIIVSFFVCLFAKSQTLQIYGGVNSDIYLGCLNCPKNDINSIWNSYGTYGSKYNSNSIWNEYGTYGSKYKTYSPWNEYASNPPKLVDKDGNLYGYLTTNKFYNKRADFGLAMTLYKYFETIRNDVSLWYDRIF